VRLTKRALAEFHLSIHNDGAAYLAGLLTDAQYWEQVEAQDAIVVAADRPDRARLARYGPGLCGCPFCLQLPLPDCPCESCHLPR
jgi:hypothetical protein